MKDHLKVKYKDKYIKYSDNDLETSIYKFLKDFVSEKESSTADTPQNKDANQFL